MSGITPVLIICLLGFLLCPRYGAAEFSLEMALTALNFSKASYCDVGRIRNWTCESCHGDSHFHLEKVFESKAAGTLAYVGVSSEYIVAAFRGTFNIKNWVEDIKFLGVPYPDENCIDCLVHGGFFSAYKSLRMSMQQTLQELIESNPQLPVFITGHSLGAALALFTAVDLASATTLPQSDRDATYPRILLYTFGKPRVGNPAFAQWVNTLIYNGGHESYRMVHKRDVVPHLPMLWMGYRHVAHELWFHHKDALEYTNCSDMGNAISPTEDAEEDYNCSDSVHAPSISDHRKYLGICTGCTCKGTQEEHVPDMNLPPTIRWMLVMDYVYARWKYFRGAYSSPGATNESS